MRWVRAIPFILIFVIAGVVIGYSLAYPRLISVLPSPNSESVPVTASVQMQFSRVMDLESAKNMISVTPNQEIDFLQDGKNIILTPNKTWLNGSRVTITINKNLKSAQFPKLTLREEVSWIFSVRDPSLVYLFPADGPANIVTFDPKTREKKPVTRGSAGVLDFDITEDGQVIYFSRNNSEGGSSIFSTTFSPSQPNESGDASGSWKSPELIVDCGKSVCRFPAISPDGNSLVYEKTNPLMTGQPGLSQIWTVNVSESENSPSEPFLISHPEHQSTQPMWTPLGLVTFYDSTRSAFIVYGFNVGISSILNNSTGFPGSWSGDGRFFIAPEIIFSDLELTEGNSEYQSVPNSYLMKYDLQDHSEERLTTEIYVEDTSPAVSPDSKKLLFARKFLDAEHWTPGRQLWLLNMDTGAFDQLTDNPFYNHHAFSWDPTGKFAVYVRFNQTVYTDPPEIWVMDIETRFGNILIKGGYSPRWIP